MQPYIEVNSLFFVFFIQGDDHRVVEEVADFLVTIVQKSTKRLLGKQMIPTINSSYSLVVNYKKPLSYLEKYFLNECEISHKNKKEDTNSGIAKGAGDVIALTPMSLLPPSQAFPLDPSTGKCK